MAKIKSVGDIQIDGVLDVLGGVITDSTSGNATFTFRGTNTGRYLSVATNSSNTSIFGYGNVANLLTLGAGGVAGMSLNDSGDASFFGNASQADAPTIGDHLTNKTYVDGLFTGDPANLAYTNINNNFTASQYVEGNVRAANGADYTQIQHNGLWYNRTTSYLAPIVGVTSTLNIGYAASTWSAIKVDVDSRIEMTNGDLALLNGDIGIGIVPSLGRLHLKQTADAYSKGIAVEAIGTSKGFIWQEGSKLHLQSGSTSGSDIILNGNGDGRVGIGTTPNVRLEVAGSVVTAEDILHISNSNGTGKVILGYEGNSDGYLKMLNGGNSEQVHITALGTSWFNGGNVGIGVANPQSIFEVKKDLDNSSSTTVDSNTHILVRNSDVNGSAVIKLLGTSSDSGVIAFGGGSGLITDKMHLTARYNHTKILTAVASGRVGIGTTSPTAKLEVIEDVADWAVKITNNNSGGKGLLIKSANAGGGTNPILQLASSASVPKFTVIENGNVGIGTDNPSTELDVNGEITADEAILDGLPMHYFAGHTTPTGIVFGGCLSINSGDAGLFDIEAGEGYVVDGYTTPATPTIVDVIWTIKSALTPTFIGSGNLSFVGINSAGTVLQQATPFTVAQRRTIIVLGVLIHPGATITNFTENATLMDGMLAEDLALAVGDINMYGNNFNPASTDLTLRKEAGESFRVGANRAAAADNPNFETSGTEANLTFIYVYDDGSSGATLVTGQTDVDPDQYDDGSGTLQAVGNNKWTNQLCYWYPGTDLAFVRYGNEIFNSFAAAEQAIGTIPPTIGNGIDPSVVRTTITVKKGASDLSSSALALFTATGKYGLDGGGGAGVGGTFQDIQDVYDNSSIAQILTDGTRGPLSIKTGTGDDSDNLFELENIAGTTVMSADGLGNATFLGNLGIGTASPNFKTTIRTPSSTGLTYALQLENPQTGDGDTGILFTVDGGSSDRGKGGLVYSRSADWNRGDFHFLQNSAATIAKASLSDSVVTILNGGNVGIGTTSPDRHLDIEATGDDDDSPTLRLTNSINNNEGDWLDKISHRIEFYSSDPSSPRIVSSIENDAGPVPGGGILRGNLVFKTESLERLRIDYLGNVGVGTAAPSRKFEVSAGGTGLIAHFKGTQDNAYISFGNSASADDRIRVGSRGTSLALVTNYLDRLTILTGGNVGIGTTAPTRLLTIEGDNGNNPLFNLRSNVATSTSDVFMAYNRDDTDTLGWSTGLESSDNSYRIAEDGNTITTNVRLYIEAGGNVGIGTTNPNAKLDVAGQEIVINDSASAPRLRFRGAGSTKGGIAASSAGNMYFSGLADAIKMTILDSGHVGIGTTTPIDELTVYGGGATGQIRMGYSDASSWAIGRENITTGDFLIISGAANPKLGITPVGKVRAHTYGSGSYTTGTPTYKAAWDADGNFMEIPYGGGAVDGSGTTNYITKWIDGDTIGNSSITDTGTTVTVNTKLTVQAGTGVSQFVSSNDAPLKVTSTDSYTGIGFEDSDGAANIHYRGSIDAFYLNGVAKLGIGTAGPSYQLHVDSGTTDQIARFQSSDNSAFISIKDDDTWTYVGAQGGTSYIGGSTGLNPLNLNVLVTGEVGIGTDTPLYKLDVAGEINIPFETDFRINSNPVMRQQSQGFRFGNLTGNDYIEANNGGTGNIQIVTNAITRMTVDGTTGNVGIGTITPLHPFSVQNKFMVTAGGSAFIPAGQGIGIDPNAGGVNTNIYFSAGQILFSGTTDVVHNNANFIIENGGNVGIGTTTPVDKLDVVGGNIRQESASGNGSLFLTKAGQTAWQTSAGTDYFNWLQEGGSELMRIQDTGNVGIGTGAVAPTDRLQVQGSSVSFKSLTSGEARHYFSMGNDGNNADFRMYDNAQVQQVHIETVGSSYFKGGSVGIGTASPQQSLHVEATGHSYIRSNTTGFTGIDIGQNSNGNIYYWNRDNTSQIWGNNAIEIMRLTSTGNLGIGTAAPGDKLEVKNGGIRIYDTANTARGIQFFRNSVRKGTIDTNGGVFTFAAEGVAQPYQFVLRASGDVYINNNQLYVDYSTGNVGIGTATPTELLEVLGTTGDNYPTIKITGDTVSAAQEPRLEFASSTGTGNYIISRIGAEVGTGYILPKFHISVADASKTLQPRITINTDGEVGIGTITPTAKLDIIGFTTADSANHYGLKIYQSGSISNSYLNVGQDIYVGSTNWSNQDTIGLNVVSAKGNSGANGTYGVKSIARSYSTNTEGASTLYGVYGAVEDTGTETVTNAYAFYAAASVGSITNAYAFYGAGSSKSYFGGNVGIGTTAPNYKVDIYGQQDLLHLGDATNVTTYMRFAGSRTMVGYSGTNAVIQGGASKGIVLRVDSNTFNAGIAALIIDTGGALRLDTYGVGTHTGTPAYKLSVDSTGNVIETAIGAGSVDGSGTTNTITKWLDADTIGDSSITDDGSSVRFNDSGGSYLEIIPGSGNKQIITSASGLNISPFSAQTRFTNNGTTSDIQIDDASQIAGVKLRAVGVSYFLGGNVGIGTNAPSNLQGWGKIVAIENTGSTGAAVSVKDTNGEFNIATYVGKLFISDGVDERVTIDTTGNVGIGTTAPDYKLDVDGVIQIRQSRSTYIDTAESSSAYAHMFVSNDSVGDFAQLAGNLIIQARVHASVYRDIIFAGGITTAEPLMTILGEGKVGIGTTAPLEKLHIRDNTSSTQAIIAYDNTIVNPATADGTTTRFAYYGHGGITAHASNIANNGMTIAMKGGASTQGIHLKTGDSLENEMFIRKDGNVGIGTTDPFAGALGLRGLHIHAPASYIGGAQLQLSTDGTGATNGLYLKVSGSTGILSTTQASLTLTTSTTSLILSAAGATLNTGVITAPGGNSTEWNTAYDNRITSLTTIGTSGAATLISNVLNIPNYANDNDNTAHTTWAWAGGTTVGPTAIISGGGHANIVVGYVPVASNTASGVVTTAGQTFAGTKTFNGGLTIGGSQLINHNVSPSRDKIRVWNSSNYAIGMDSGYTFGGLVSDYAMTFQMNNSSLRGFWWGDDSHTNAQGAMALTTDGKLTVARSMRLGYGEADTTTPGVTYTIDVSGTVGGFDSLISGTELVAPRIILDSTSTGDNWTSQGAAVYIGESASDGDAGTAKTVMTYVGNGTGYFGMGVVTAGVPTQHIKFSYQGASAITTNDDFQVVGRMTATTMTLNSLPSHSSEATALMINGSEIVGYRELGTNAFTSNDYLRADIADVKTAGNLTFNNNTRIRFGTSNVASIRSNGSNTYFELTTGNLYITDSGTVRHTFFRDSGNFTANGQVAAADLLLTGLSNQGSEQTALVIDGSNQVGTRELGTNAFTSNDYIRADADDSFSGGLVSTSRDEGIFGTYDSYKTDHIWSMGTGYKNSATGADFGNLYGAAYYHNNNGTHGALASGHQFVWVNNGDPKVALGTNIWTSGIVTATGGNSTEWNLGYDYSLVGHLLDTTDTLTGTLTVTTAVKTDKIQVNGGQQLVLSAGESDAQATGQAGEKVYVNAEYGLQINSSPDNWSSSWAGRFTANICGILGESTFPGEITVTGDSNLDGNVFIDTTSGANALYVGRTGTSSESLKMWTDDATSYFQTIQDENLANFANMVIRLGSQAGQQPNFTINDYTSGSDVHLFSLDAADKSALFSGDVGIGTSAPLAPLDVQGKDVGDTSAFKVRNSSGTETFSVGNNGKIFLNGSQKMVTGASFIELRNNATGNATLQSDTSYSLLLNPTGGNVGIGTTAPAVLFEVESVSTSAISISNTNPGTVGTPIEGKLQFRGYNNDIKAEIAGQDKASNLVGGWLAMRTTNDSNVLTDRLIIDRDGYVGIGTTTPSSLLDVLGTATVSDLIVTDEAFAASYGRKAHETGFLEGGYSNIGVSNTKTSPIYCIGSAYAPTEEALSNMYGVGYAYNSATFLNATDLGSTPASGWGFYVAADGQARILLEGSTGNIRGLGNLDINEGFFRGDVRIGDAPVIGLGRLTIHKDNAPCIITIEGGLNTETTLGGEIGSIDFKSNDPSILSTNDIAARIVAVNELANGAWGGLAFYTARSTPSPYIIEKMRLNNEGKLGLGTILPNEFLTLAQPDSAISIIERSAAPSLTVGYGKIWVKDDVANTLWFTDDAGGDHQLGLSGGIDNIVEDTTPELGGTLVVGEEVIQLDESPTTGTASGTILVLPTGDTNAFVFGDLVALDSNGKLIKADATTNNELPAIGIAIETIAISGSGRVLIHGTITLSTWSWTKGNTLYTSGTDGNMTQTRPNPAFDGIQAVAVAITDKVILFNPSYLFEPYAV